MNKVSDGSLVATYTYYHDGLRKSKTVGGVTTNYSWDASGNLVQESDGNGNTLASYYYAGKDNLIGFKKNGVTYIYHTNLRGDVVSVTDENGAIQVQYSYDPWGNVKSTDGTLAQPFRYAGYYSDDETGLIYLKSRYYSPNLGRFLTRDAYKYIDYKNPQTMNLYSYCKNNPVSNVDPSGTDSYHYTYDEDGNVNRTIHIDDNGAFTVTDNYGNVLLKGSEPGDYDYISLSAVSGGVAITISWDNFGNSYSAVGGGLGIGVSLSFGKLNDNYVTEDEIKNYLTGFSGTISGGFIVGAGWNKSFSNKMWAIEHGYSTPGVEIYVTYGWINQ